LQHIRSFNVSYILLDVLECQLSPTNSRFSLGDPRPWNGRAAVVDTSDVRAHKRYSRAGLTLDFPCLGFLFPPASFSSSFPRPIGGGTVVGSGNAPRSRMRPSFSVSVIIGLAAGLNLNSLEYLSYMVVKRSRLTKLVNYLAAWMTC